MAECKNVYAELVYKESGYVDNTIYVMDPEKGLRKVIIINIKKVEMTTPSVSGEKCKVIKADMELSSSDIDLKEGLDRAIMENLVLNPKEAKFECMLDLYSLQLITDSKKLQIRAIKHYLRDALDENIEITELLSHGKYDGYKLKIKIMMKLYGKVLIPIDLMFLLDIYKKVFLTYISHNDKFYKLKDLHKVLLEKTIK